MDVLEYVKKSKDWGFFNLEIKMFFLRKKKKDSNYQTKKPIKKGWRVFGIIMAVIAIIGISYMGYLYASGKRIFDPKSLTGSPFFGSKSDSENLRGEGDGRINILLLGIGGANHPGGMLTDSIMVASIDPNEKTMAMLSIPRDLYTPIAGTKKSVKINEIYSIGEKEKKGRGATLVKDSVGKILDLPIHYYMVADFYGFVKFINGIGGVDVNVEKNLNDPYYPDANMQGYDPFYIKAGQQHLDGEKALKYSRSRETTSDFDRAARQQQIISATKEKILKIGFLANPKKIVNIVNTIGDHVRTDFTATELMSLADLVKNLDSSKTVNKVLTNAEDGELVSNSSNGTFYLLPKGGNWDNIQKLAHEIFTEPNLKKENAKIEVLNGTNTTGQAGRLADILRSYNYKVVSIASAPKKYKNTQITDYTNGDKPVTLSFLQKRLKASVSLQNRISDNVDITIIIGDDYKGFIKNP